MKVFLINGSPKPDGCTYTALTEVANVLQEEGVQTEIFHIGKEVIRGCGACFGCITTMNGKCAHNNDSVNIALEKIREADAVIIGSPVHFAAASGEITSFLDRVFFAGDQAFAATGNKDKGGFHGKLGAAVVSCRRGGSTAALDQLNKYFTISNMPIVSSQYWNMVHGMTPEEVKLDLEGLQVLRTLGKNMAWLLKCIKTGKEKGLIVPA